MHAGIVGVQRQVGGAHRRGFQDLFSVRGVPAKELSAVARGRGQLAVYNIVQRNALGGAAVDLAALGIKGDQEGFVNRGGTVVGFDGKVGTDQLRGLSVGRSGQHESIVTFGQRAVSDPVIQSFQVIGSGIWRHRLGNDGAAAAGQNGDIDRGDLRGAGDHAAHREGGCLLHQTGVLIGVNDAGKGPVRNRGRLCHHLPRGGTLRHHHQRIVFYTEICTGALVFQQPAAAALSQLPHL